ncbi:glycogen synthase [Hippea jasoniae]|uniref:glycogen synthase n=1 Tax=Hippea jasoniae TaxID=944479 RepID=UPI00054D9E06|nr:glycogen/starch synthase [Hippea jasoniae]
MKLLFATVEFLGYAKAGGLADISYSLTKQLKKHIDVDVVVPLYNFAKNKLKIASTEDYEEFLLHKAKLDDVELLCVEEKTLSSTDTIYTDNDVERFIIFSKAIYTIALKHNHDVIHLNDWHTAFAAYLIKKTMKKRVILTVHNLAYQGICNCLPESIGIDKKDFDITTFEYYSKVNLLKGGIAYSDKVVFPSDEFLKESLNSGFGLEGFLSSHKDKLTSILNCIDYDDFNPQTDQALKKNFDSANIKNRWFNKAFLMKKFSLEDKKLPLFAFIGRFTHQKGLDLIIDAIEDLLKKDLNFIMVGDRNSEYFTKLSTIKKENFVLIEKYEEGLARLIYAASDFIIIPSVFEPCGLVQLIAFRYGAIPIAHATGGLKQTIHPINKKQCGMGIVYNNQIEDELITAVDEALDLYKNKQKLLSIRRFNMKCDFSCAQTAQKYLKLYD